MVDPEMAVELSPGPVLRRDRGAEEVPEVGRIWTGGGEGGGR